MSSSLRVLNHQNNYSDIINIFAEGTDSISPYYVVTYNFTNITDQSTFSSNLINSATGFRRPTNTFTKDLSEIYLTSFRGPYSNMASQSNNIINTNLAYRYIYFWLQSPGGNGTTFVTSPNYRGGNGGSGSYVFGYIDLLTNPINNYTIWVRPQSDTVNIGSFISFTGGSQNITITCNRGSNSTGANQGGVGGSFSPTSSAGLSGVTYIDANFGITGVNEGNGVTRTNNYYINTFASYGNKFQPLTSTYDTYGAGGAGATSSSNLNQTGTQGFCFVWFKR